MEDYEKLGVFYLGRHYDLAKKQGKPDLLLYDSKHLVTHGLVVGMTGSGKTGLCFDIIEEAAIDGIPAIVVDPKGDLGNLLLTFPDLRPADFEPWVNADDARKKGLSVQDFAAQQADLWGKGLASWRQDGDRIRRLRDAAEFTIYTPGSSVGFPVSILSSFAVPPPEILEDMESFRDRVSTTVAGLLSLVGIEADPVKSRETILLASLVQEAWKNGRDLDLATLIRDVQSPPMPRIGVLDVESFFPSKDRFALSMQLNNLLASPSFASWMEGEPLDIGRILFTAEGKPRVAVFSVAHLSDPERMFFVSLLLNQVLGWMRTQSGTGSLRALFYMDEIFGYFPPVANPPSKLPLLTLLKQARAFGVGVILATQNPVDLDYKGLANIGSWFIGRLQTDRDKARVLDGLEGAAAGRGASFDRAAMEQTLAGLGSRVFLLRDVNEDDFEIFESRWAMSYLRGPLSRNELKQLMDPRKKSSTPSKPVPASSSVAAAPPGGGSAAPSAKASSPVARPVLPPAVPQFFAPVRGSTPPGSTVVYQPRLLGSAQVRFADAKSKVDVMQELTLLTEITDSAVPVDWATSEELSISVGDLEKAPVEAQFEDCASAASNVKNYAQWSRDFTNWIYGSRKLTIFKSMLLKQTSNPGEEERDFRIRLLQKARELRDDAAEKLRQKYTPRVAALNDRLLRAQAAREREAQQSRQSKLDTMISLGSTILGAFLGRKAMSASTLGKAATTARGVGRSMTQSADVVRADETVEAIQTKIGELDTQFKTDTEAVVASIDPATESLEAIELRASKTNINVRLVALAWLPHFRGPGGEVRAAF